MPSGTDIICRNNICQFDHNTMLDLRCLAISSHALLATRQIDLQGIGRHSWEYVQRRLRQEFEALDALLESNQFLTGDTPCQADCFLFATLEGVCA